MADMQGKMTNREGMDLFLSLSLKTKEEREAIPFALFVSSKGMLNGEEAYIYLKNKAEKCGRFGD